MFTLKWGINSCNKIKYKKTSINIKFLGFSKICYGGYHIKCKTQKRGVRLANINIIFANTINQSHAPDGVNSVLCLVPFSQSSGGTRQTRPHPLHCLTRHQGWSNTCCRRLAVAGHRRSCPAGTPFCWCPSAGRQCWCHSSPDPASYQRCVSWYLGRSCQTMGKKHGEREPSD